MRQEVKERGGIYLDARGLRAILVPGPGANNGDAGAVGGEGHAARTEEGPAALQEMHSFTNVLSRRK